MLAGDMCRTFIARLRHNFFSFFFHKDLDVIHVDDTDLYVSYDIGQIIYMRMYHSLDSESPTSGGI